MGLKAIDNKARAGAEVIAHAIQRWTGRSSFYLTWWCGTASLAGKLLDIANYWLELPFLHKPSLYIVVSAGLCILSVWSFVERYRQADEEFQEGDEALPTGAALLLAADAPILVSLRVVCLGMVLSGLVVSALLNQLDALVDGTLAFTAMIYFGTVTPLPPGPSRIAEWFRGLGFNLTPAPTRGR